MKRNLFILLFIIPLLIAAQDNRRNDHNGQDKNQRDNQRQKIEQLEMKRLIEVLNISHEKVNEFYARRNELFDTYSKLRKEKNELLDNMEKDIKTNKKLGETYYKSEIKKVMEIEHKMNNARDKFIGALKSMFNPEQIAKYLLFETRFREELQSLQMRPKGQ